MCSRTISVPTKAHVHQTKQSEDAAPTPTLMGIPGEIRNRIYRFALINDKSVRLDREACAEPALLSASRQIRKEARPIFQKENLFTIHVHDFVAPTKPHWIWYSEVPQERIYITMCGDPIWNNLCTWLQDYHKGQAKWMDFVAVEDGPMHWVVNCFFSIVEKLVDVEWETVESVVRDARDVSWSPGDEQWIELDSDGEEIISAY